jgi:DNA-binding transcriptional LysR family regulator
MELRQLEHFLAVAEHGSFTRAAREVHIVQSALSSSIRALEADLGAPLFQRTTRRVVLAPAGEALLPAARQILGTVRVARRQVAAVSGLVSGRLALGSIQTLTAVNLPDVLARFHRTYPGVQVTLREAPSPRLVDALRAADLDLAFCSLDPDALPGDLVALDTHREEIVLVTSPDHALARRSGVKLSALADEPFVDFQPGTGLQMLVEELCGREGLVRRSTFQLSQMDQLLSLVARGLGVALVPASIAEGAGLPAVPLSIPYRHRTIALVGHASTSTNPSVQAFLRALRGDGESMAGGSSPNPPSS